MLFFIGHQVVLNFPDYLTPWRLGHCMELSWNTVFKNIHSFLQSMWHCFVSNIQFTMFYWVHLHLQSGEQSRFALLHLQLEQFPLQEHLISSLHDQEISGIVIQTGTSDSGTMVQAKFCGEGAKPDVFVCWSSRFLLDTLPIGHAGVTHPLWVAVCPLLDFFFMAEEFPSCLFDRTQKTRFVIQDNSQSLKL